MAWRTRGLDAARDRSTTRWRLDGVSNVAIHSEEFERIDIAHLTEDGYIHAATPKGIAPATIDGLLDAWLNAQKGGGFSYVRPPESVTVAAPHIDLDGKISARKRTFTFGPGAYMPFDSVDRETRQVTMIWPPKGSPSTVSPEAESARKFPSKKLESDSSIVVTDRGNKALRVFLRWPEPLASLMPLLSGADDMLSLKPKWYDAPAKAPRICQVHSQLQQ